MLHFHTDNSQQTPTPTFNDKFDLTYPIIINASYCTWNSSQISVGKEEEARNYTNLEPYIKQESTELNISSHRAHRQVTLPQIWPTKLSGSPALAPTARVLADGSTPLRFTIAHSQNNWLGATVVSALTRLVLSASTASTSVVSASVRSPPILASSR